MDDTTRMATATLLQVYADIDLLALELCSDRLPFAPTAEARKELLHQINEEVLHFTLQEQTLLKLTRPFLPVISQPSRQEIKAWFSGLDWYGFLAGLQLGIEGIGISVVELVSHQADPLIQESLRVPIADELRQASFGVREWRKLLSGSSVSEKEEHRRRVLGIFEAIYRMTETALPVPFEECWAILGLRKSDLWDAVRSRTEKVLTQVGFEPALPESFVA
ncbi:MAG: hypothetical protein M1537_03660 [Nitrospirae bacterium]|nr:MAG: hypothetical protein D084_Lepto4C00555G0005 [Leptospirillum sp. Group IV 'UBA BS']MCL4485427.1 hypothetical protein [Nitrospirota bacterium]MCL5285014.1 hypothetical protein [Nitrospirota bacterium]